MGKGERKNYLVLVCFGSYNKIPEAVWLKQRKGISQGSSDWEVPRSRYPGDSVSAVRVPGVPFIKALIPLMGAPPSWPNYFQSTTSNYPHVFSFNMWNWGRHKRSVYSKALCLKANICQIIGWGHACVVHSCYRTFNADDRYAGASWPLRHGVPLLLSEEQTITSICFTKRPIHPFPFLPLARLSWLDLPVSWSGRQLCGGRSSRGSRPPAALIQLSKRKPGVDKLSVKSRHCVGFHEIKAVSHHRGLFSGQPSKRVFVSLRNAGNIGSSSPLLEQGITLALLVSDPAKK